MSVDYDKIAESISPRQLAEALDCKKSGKGWSCPLPDRHENGDLDPSFSVFRDGERTAAKCHGCDLKGSPVTVASEVWGVPLPEAARRLAERIGLGSAGNGSRPVVERYVYHDPEGRELFRVCRTDPKDFFVQRREGGGWVNGGPKVWTPYRLPDLTANTERHVVVAEGEKDVDRLASLGFTATTNPGGAGKWRREYSDLLAGRTVSILPDNDKAGRKHAREVARSLVSAGCIVRVVDLPELALKGDVSDWLDGGGNASKLKKVITETPIWIDPGGDEPEPDRGKLTLTPLGDLLDEPDEETEWLVEDRLPAGGLSVIVGKPKAGKSTLARCLCLAVARGDSWLGMATSKGPVFYLALEEKRQEVKNHFRLMGADREDEIFCFVAPSPQNGHEQLEEATRLRKPSLIVIDPLFRFSRVKDSNDYSVVTAAFEPLMSLARESGAHLMLAHHAGKRGGEGGDGILGSTAIFGSVDTAMFLKRSDRYRTLSSIQRYGSDLEEVVVELDEETGWVEAAGSRKEADERSAGESIIEFLEEQREAAVDERSILDAVDGRKLTKQKALRRLLEEGKIERSGGGKRGDPYLYFISTSLHPIYTRDAEMQKPIFDANEAKQSGNSASAKTADFGGEDKTRDAETEAPGEVF